jgi:hypothetical protein
MDLQEFLTQGPLQQLLVLMIVPVFATILLVGYIVFSFSRRKKKSKMKLGIQPKKTVGSRTVVTSISGTEFSGAEDDPVDEVRLDVVEKSTDPLPPPEMEPPPPPPVLEEPVDLSIWLENTQPGSPASRPKEPVTMLRLLREPQTGQLFVEIGGERYGKLSDITDRDTGQLVLQLTAHLLAFTNGNIFTQEGMKNLPRPNVGNLPQPPDEEPLRGASGVSGSTGQVQSAPPEVEAEFLASLRSGKISSSPRSSRPWSRETQRRREQSISSSPSAGVPGLNLAYEINEIVKEKLNRSPLAATTRIEITNNLDGSLRIMVNNQSYSAPDDIPDETIRNLIKNSIKEWERR